jgi:tetratricopeptide (TPR) repeat protein
VNNRRLVIAWCALLLFTAWAYWPGLSGPMVLDDFVNLRPLDRLELNEGFAADIVEGNRSGLLGRPVSMASFALERLYFDDGEWGQKRFGLVLHLLNGTLVLLLSLRLLRGASQPEAGLGALLIAGAWLTLPLLLSTTLYVVQRMTLLSATFCLLALLAYCRGRDPAAARAWPWFAGSGVAVLLAALSKENGLLAVPMIVAVEVFVFGFRDRSGQLDRRLAWGHTLLVLVPLAMLLLLALLVPERLVGGYSLRSFGLAERVLTQGRVLMDYLVQILWVDVHRLGVYHDDFPLSESVFSPGTTAAALLFWLVSAAAIAACAVRQRFRLAAFGVAFFMIGHAMESTFIPLEIYFEHRNYLPAFGILFALVAALRQLEARWQPLQGWVTLLAVLFIGRNLLLLGSQAVIWSDNNLLHMEAVNYHPRSERALMGLAQAYAVEGNLEVALDLLQRANAVGERGGAPAEVLDAVFYCLAARPLSAELFRADTLEDEEIASLYFGDHVYYMTRLVISGRCSRASGLLFANAMRDWLRGDGEPRGTRQIFGSLLLLENHLERFPEAMSYAGLLTRKDPENVMGLQFTLYLSHVLEAPEKAEFARSKLIELRDRGELSRQETSNLELFLQ